MTAWFEDAWAFREEQLYPELFGPLRSDIAVLTENLFRNTFRHNEIDPRWLHHGVLVSPPNERRGTFMVVSSGLSNAWLDDQPHPEGPSGLGHEFLLEVSTEGGWESDRVAHVVAFQLLLQVGKYRRKSLLAEHDRIPLRVPIDGRASRLTWLLVCSHPDYADVYQTPSGHLRFLHLVGITPAEAGLARFQGSSTLISSLLKARGFPVTDPDRKCLVSKGAA